MEVGIDGVANYFEMEFKKCFVIRYYKDGTSFKSIVYLKQSDVKSIWNGEKVFIAYAYERNPEDQKWQLKNDDIERGSKTAHFRFEAYLPLAPAEKLIGQK